MAELVCTFSFAESSKSFMYFISACYLQCMYHYNIANYVWILSWNCAKDRILNWGFVLQSWKFKKKPMLFAHITDPVIHYLALPQTSYSLLWGDHLQYCLFVGQQHLLKLLTSPNTGFLHVSTFSLFWLFSFLVVFDDEPQCVFYKDYEIMKFMEHYYYL